MRHTTRSCKKRSNLDFCVGLRFSKLIGAGIGDASSRSGEGVRLSIRRLLRASVGMLTRTRK
jgi:hypothetical protein